MQGTTTGRFKADKPNISAVPRGKAQHVTVLDDDWGETIKQKKKRKKDVSAAVVDSYCFLKNNGLL